MRYTKKNFSYGLKNFLANLLLVWSVVLFYNYNKYYSSFLFTSTQDFILWLAIIYSVGTFVKYILIPSKNLPKSKGLIIIEVIIRSLGYLFDYLKDFSKNIKNFDLKISKEEKNTILFVLVKIFFLPLMINFASANYSYFLKSFVNIPSLYTIFQVDIFNRYTYACILGLFFLVDTLYFIFGYAVESDLLNNKVRSVEPTLFGWVVALICYPPFNGVIQQYSSWYASDYVGFGSAEINYVMHIVLLITFSIYVWATLALGPKSSNLTNRGIVSRGPYQFVRHPAYISKNLFWWITIIPILSFPAILSMTVWSFIYFLRAITEERHLIKDPDYQAYCKKVKYRFIPYVV